MKKKCEMALKTVCAAVLLLVVLGGGALSASGDVLVTNSGFRVEGEVIDEGTSYVVVLPNGGKITFPKSMVKEVIRQGPSEAAAATEPAKPSAASRPTAITTDKPPQSPAPEPTGKWHFWTRGPMRYHAHGGNSLWFSCEGIIYRYDLKAKTFERFGPLEGLPLGAEHIRGITTAPDGRCAFIIRCGLHRVFLWTPGVGFRMLPIIARHEDARAVTFDADGRLLCLAGVGRGASRNPTRLLYEFADGAWKPFKTVPQTDILFALPDGRFLTSEGIVGSSGKGAVLQRVNPPRKAVFYRLGEKVYALSSHLDKRDDPDPRGANLVHELTPNGFVALAGFAAAADATAGQAPAPAARKLVCIDLKDQCFRVVRPVKAKNKWQQAYKIDGIPGLTIELDVSCEQEIMPVRDPNGTVWCAGKGWDGDAWRPIDPKMHAPIPSGINILGTSRARLNEADMTWEDLIPDGPAFTSHYDPATGCAWVRTSLREGDMDYVRFDRRGRTVLRHVVMNKLQGFPHIQGPEGDWWGNYTVLCRAPLRRLTKDGWREYSVSNMQVDEKTVWGVHGVLLSPKNSIWIAACNNRFLRYDANLDRLISCEYWDDFSFRVGDLNLSVRLFGHDFDSLQVYEKVGMSWRQFMPEALGRPRVYVRSHMVDGDRMLAGAERIGALEYDGANDRWARPHVGPLAGGFDERGRRVFLRPGWILMFDGDPFDVATDRLQAEATKKHVEFFRRMLVLLDDDDERVRSGADWEIRQIVLNIRSEVEKAANDTSCSARVREALQKILKQVEPPKVTLPPGIFRLMHPEVRPPVHCAENQPAENKTK